MTEAHGMGILRELVPADELLDRAVAIADLADKLDEEFPAGMTSDDARHAHRRDWEQLKGRPAEW